MNRYEEYQETGFEWLGKIPSNWGLSRVGKFFTERSEKVDDITYPPLSVTMSGIVDQLSHVAKTNDGGNRKLVKKHDFVINSRSDRKGSSGISPRDGSVSLINIVLEPRELDPQFIQYLFKNYYFKEEYFRNGKGIHWDLWTTKWDQLKNIKFPIPSNKEQKLISHYLDKKIEQIDSLIEKIQKKIELLKEQRTSLINQCVTKGLDPNVEMKDSGVEWIGEIPKHWKLSRVKFELNIHNDNRVPLSAEVRGDRQGEYPYYGSTSIIDWVDDYLFDGRFILLAEDGGNLVLRNLRLSFIVEGKFWVNNHAHILKSDNDLYDHYYCEFLEQSDFTTFITGSAQPKLTLEAIKTVPVCVPNEDEISEITSELRTIKNQFRKLIEIHEKKIKYLEEYRQSLISSVVTGKVRVTEDMI